MTSVHCLTPPPHQFEQLLRGELVTLVLQSAAAAPFEVGARVTAFGKGGPLTVEVVAKRGPRTRTFSGRQNRASERQLVLSTTEIDVRQVTE